MSKFEHKIEKYTIVLLLIILIGLAACVKKEPTVNGPGPLGTVVENAESIGTMLGCMFNPKVCEEVRQQQEWENVDKDLKKPK